MNMKGNAMKYLFAVAGLAIVVPLYIGADDLEHSNDRPKELIVELPFDISFEFRRVSLRMVTPFECSHMRSRFTKLIRQEFRMDAAHITHTPSFYLSNYEIHHIKPILLGGDNKSANLALVEPQLHIALHDFIDGQTGGMEPGDERTIDLPYMRGMTWPKPINN